MKKILTLLIVLYGHLFALDKESTLKIYRQVFSSILHTGVVKVYTKDKELLKVFEKAKDIQLVDEPEMSDIVIVGNCDVYEKVQQRLIEKKHQVPIFATDYHLLKKYPYIIGALYWKKGRSQLLFLQPRLKKYHISLPDDYKPFIVESL